jgi:plastocyanin
MNRSGRRALPLLLPILGLAAITAGCGDDDDDAADTSATETTAADTSAAEDVDADVIEVIAVDYGFDDLPATVPAGTTLTLQNSSDREVHELVAMALPAGETRSVEELLALPEEELGALFAVQPGTVLVAPPGEGSFAAVGDGSLTEPGRYVIACFIPTGADPEEFLQAAQEAEGGPPQVAGGPPHFTAGMFAELTVE